ncbi:3-deoxy-manno-octulosonate cytidylyltransferase [Gluconacetobacter takamatsuzukensis]|uniref:3-deoxy-manno-octulosonate cytidylyltransferase n=1 Tax=Gluconacetobacter takamatsuzukensis TaxID=1286190 RepID=A0A7W4KCS4_9PROT|nr:3-deoxy-manno-octulosonate cytidylyltransferase [Gluconacetobacter takamatsuzukensis]MBB2204465.1 3-deoxy-manno-octulosonate cytidylyltransferase [Gluconacetobacter takamatsuzukensis]
MNPIVIIPARMASTRLPGKPLAMIGDRPMILHVLERARAANIGPVVVAVAEAELAQVVAEAGGTAVLTDPALPSGSDRVWHALATVDPDGRHDVVVNLQGDLPGLAPETLAAALLPLADRAVDIGTLVAPVTEPGEARSESVVKVACAFPDAASDAAPRAVARALYFSRAAVPWGEGALWHHVGIYAYRRAALARFVALPEAALERREKLEQLRALEAGMTIGCARIGVAPFGVDTPADLERARRMLADVA